MVLAQVEFIAEEARHQVALERQPSATGCLVKVDGKTQMSISIRVFKKRFALLGGFCTVSGVDLGRFFTRYKIKIEQPSKPNAV